MHELGLEMHVRDIEYPFGYSTAIGDIYINKVLKRFNKRLVFKERETLLGKEIEPVAIVGRNYALIPNELVEEIAEKAARAYNLTISKIEKDKNEHKLRINLLSERLEEVKVGDKVQFGVSIRNSIDTSSSLAVDLFSLRLACKNGATVASYDKINYMRHIGNPNELLSLLNKALSSALEKIDNLLYEYRRLTGRILTVEGAKRLVVGTKFASSYYKYTPIKVDDDIHLEREESLWDTYNEITYVITHESKANPISKTLISNRLYKVITTI